MSTSRETLCIGNVVTILGYVDLENNTDKRTNEQTNVYITYRYFGKIIQRSIYSFEIIRMLVNSLKSVYLLAVPPILILKTCSP